MSRYITRAIFPKERKSLFIYQEDYGGYFGIISRRGLPSFPVDDYTGGTLNSLGLDYKYKHDGNSYVYVNKVIDFGGYMNHIYQCEKCKKYYVIDD